MRDYSLIEKVFLLKSTPPFENLEDQELFNIADVLTTVEFKSGESVLKKDSTVNYLYLIVDGEVVSESGDTSVKVIGVKPILDGSPATESFIASRNGTACLRMGKGHFFTTLYDCPNVIVEFMELEGRKKRYFY